MTERTEARIAGIAYLSYVAINIPSSVIWDKATAGTSVSQQLSSLSRMMLPVRVSILLDLLQVLCAVILAVTLYRLTKAVDPTLSLIAMSFRIGEGLLGALPILDRLELMQLATASSADLAGNNLLLRTLLNRPDEQFSEFCFVMGGFLFAYLLLRGRLIPRWLAWIGVITIGIQSFCVCLSIAGFIDGAAVDLLWMLILAYEIPLGFWLIFKGIAKPAWTAGMKESMAEVGG